MPVAIQPNTMAALKEAVRVRAKIDTTDTDSLSAIEGFINQRYLNVATEHQWRWLRDKRDLRIPAVYSTGTVSVTVDSREVTGASTVWTDAMVGRFIKISGDDHIYQLVSRLSNTTIELSERVLRASGSSLSYQIFQSEFGLWPDVENIGDVWLDSAGDRSVIRAISPKEYWEIAAASPEDTGKPKFFTRDGQKSYEGVPIGQWVVGYDFIGTPESYRICFLPRIPSGAINAHIGYFKKVEPLAAATDTPLMPLEDRWVLVYGALADWYNLSGNETSMAYWNLEFEKGVKRMLRDHNKTDSKAQLVVPDRWRRRAKPSPARYDLGEYFDKYY